MKVKELIAELQKYNPDENVMLWAERKHKNIESVSPMFWDGVNGEAGCMPVISDGSKSELTKFGGMCRRLRAKHDFFLMDVCKAVEIRPSKLSSIEFGEMPLSTELASKICNFMIEKCGLLWSQAADLIDAANQQAGGIIERYQMSEEEKAEVEEFSARLKEISQEAAGNDSNT